MSLPREISYLHTPADLAELTFGNRKPSKNKVKQIRISKGTILHLNALRKCGSVICASHDGKKMVLYGFKTSPCDIPLVPLTLFSDFISRLHWPESTDLQLRSRKRRLQEFHSQVLQVR